MRRRAGKDHNSIWPPRRFWERNFKQEAQMWLIIGGVVLVALGIVLVLLGLLYQNNTSLGHRKTESQDWLGTPLPNTPPRKVVGPAEAIEALKRGEKVAFSPEMRSVIDQEEP
jgi:hypothetical protein